MGVRATISLLSVPNTAAGSLARALAPCGGAFRCPWGRRMSLSEIVPLVMPITLLAPPIVCSYRWWEAIMRNRN
jgi:hypothetical protein